MSFDTSCFMTTFKNVSAGSLFFGFLPPHGATLAAAAEVSVLGHPADIVSRGDRQGNQRFIDSFAKAVTDGVLQVTATPALIIKDATAPHAPKIVTLTSGTLGSADPCYLTVLP